MTELVSTTTVSLAIQPNESVTVKTKIELAVQTLAIGFVIYFVWKVTEGFFSGTKKSPINKEKARPKNQNRDGFTDYEEVD